MPRWLKILLGVIAEVVLVTLLGRLLSDQIATFAAWVDRQGRLAPLLYIVGYVVATVLLIPGSLLTLAAGAIFGLGWGTVYAFVAATAAESAAFLLARHAVRPLVERRLRSDARFAKIDRAIARKGFRVVLLLRLSPLLPFNLLNYALGLTTVSFADVLLSAVGMLPGTLLYVYSGTVVGGVARLAAGVEVPHTTGYYLVLGLGLAATIAVTIVMTRIARRALEEETDGVTDTRA
jgi:uncharacterized membrane protein YdjX (TVP38/TMEM64 family)